MKTYRHIVNLRIILLMMLLPSMHIGQHFRNISEMFPMSAAEGFFQDRDGFLWIATVHGLVRFDGYTTQVFTHDPHDFSTMGGNNVKAIAQDGSGRLWIGLRYFGLNILDPRSGIFTRICIPSDTSHCRHELSIFDIVPGADQSMWVASDNGLYRYSSDTDPQFLEHHLHDPDDSYSLSDNNVYYLLHDSKERIWAGTRKGINLTRDNNGYINYHTDTSFPDTQILDIAEDREGNVWISTRFIHERLFVFDEATTQFVADALFLGVEHGEFKISFAPNNDLWISSRGVGVFHVAAASRDITFYNPEQPALHGYRKIYGLQIYTDSYGNIWSAGDPVYQWPSSHKSFLHLRADDAPVVSVFGNAQGIWFSDNLCRYFLYEEGFVKPFLPEHMPSVIRPPELFNPPSRMIHSISPLGESSLLMSTTRNVILCDLNSGACQDYPSLYGGPFRDLVHVPGTKDVWICGNQGSPILFDLSTGEYHSPSYATEIRNPNCVIIGAQGDLWFGTYTDGIFRLEIVGDTFQVGKFSPDQPDGMELTDYTVNALSFAPDGELWAATNLGINIIDPQTYRVQTLRKQAAFVNESVMSLEFDVQGRVWMGTQQGLVRYDPVDSSFVRYERSDGLINAVYTRNASYRDENGILYFGGDRGIDFFDPLAIGQNTVAPDLHVGKILVNNVRIDSAIAAHHMREIILKHTENFIEIELLALHYTAPESNTYAYRIPEIDDAWRETGTRRVITLSSLRPGVYTLHARAANADGFWSDPKQLLRFTITPPFWATWWFIALCIALMLLLVVLAYRYRIRQVQTRERLKADFNQRLAEWESKALRAQMNPHFLFNSINSVKSLIAQGENARATQYLTRFGQLIRQVLANSEKPMIRLQEEIEALRLYLEIEMLRFQNFEYKIDIGDGVNADFIEVPPLILQPYVENAIWHGLMHKTTGERRVDILISRSNGLLKLVVEDNGIGRTRAGQIKLRGDTRKRGMGMRLASDRLNVLRRHYSQDVSIAVYDLHDQQGQPTGTRVQVLLPCPD